MKLVDVDDAGSMRGPTTIKTINVVADDLSNPHPHSLFITLHCLFLPSHSPQAVAMVSPPSISKHHWHTLILETGIRTTPLHLLLRNESLPAQIQIKHLAIKRPTSSHLYAFLSSEKYSAQSTATSLQDST